MAERRMITKRKEAYLNSDLPYSFEYKIRNYFYGEHCPVCNAKMQVDREFGLRNRIPTIQHNKPISIGGKHDLSNISVICRQCNVTIKDKETSSLNNKKVLKAWSEINNEMV